ncbi:MAG: hypothetical protein OXG49_13945 [Chloroflexi bacterium]|nr:hypothetical protein [Chloroflexota bacterium]
MFPAEKYSIRIEINTNVSAESSLDAARLETLPAGTVVDMFGEYKPSALFWIAPNRILNYSQGCDIQE